MNLTRSNYQPQINSSCVTATKDIVYQTHLKAATLLLLGGIIRTSTVPVGLAVGSSSSGWTKISVVSSSVGLSSGGCGVVMEAGVDAKINCV